MAAARSSSCNTFPHWFSGLLVAKNHGPLIQMSDVDHVERHVGGIRPVGQIPYLIDDQNMRVRVGGQRLMEVSLQSS
jgi:hypothetical protein